MTTLKSSCKNSFRFFISWSFLAALKYLQFLNLKQVAMYLAKEGSCCCWLLYLNPAVHLSLSPRLWNSLNTFESIVFWVDFFELCLLNVYYIYESETLSLKAYTILKSISKVFFQSWFCFVCVRLVWFLFSEPLLYISYFNQSTDHSPYK